MVMKKIVTVFALVPLVLWKIPLSKKKPTHTYTRICTHVYIVVKLKMGCGKDRCL